jgi:hypothetical protein
MQARCLVIAGALATTIACAGSAPTAPTADSTLAISPSTLGLDAHASAGGPGRGAPAKVRQVKSGTISTTTTGMSGTLTLSGPRFELTGSWSDGGSNGCQPCQSGSSTIWTSAAFAGSPGSATVDGVHYDTVYLSGGVRMSGTIVVPAADSPSFTVSFPFATEQSSVLIGYVSNPLVGPAQELFRLDLRGSGTGTIELNTIVLPDSTKIYTGRTIRYEF